MENQVKTGKEKLAAGSTVAVQLHAFRTEACVLAREVEVSLGDMVIIRDEEGEDLGQVVGVLEGAEAKGVVLRRATAQDLERKAELDVKCRRVLELFIRQKDEFKLDMKVVDAHWRWDRKKICFYFVSEQRLDFRGLHKMISSALNIRVAIKQIGARDHARFLGGLGPCGRELCCRQFIRELRPVALRMARQQNLFVDPSKISGLCGKLQCCLGFEEESYRKCQAALPKIGTQVTTAQGKGRVVGHDVLAGRITVRYEDGQEAIVTPEEVALDNGESRAFTDECEVMVDGGKESEEK